METAAVSSEAGLVDSALIFSSSVATTTFGLAVDFLRLPDVLGLFEDFRVLGAETTAASTTASTTATGLAVVVALVTGAGFLVVGSSSKTNSTSNSPSFMVGAEVCPSTSV